MLEQIDLTEFADEEAAFRRNGHVAEAGDDVAVVDQFGEVEKPREGEEVMRAVLDVGLLILFLFAEDNRRPVRPVFTVEALNA